MKKLVITPEVHAAINKEICNNIGFDFVNNQVRNYSVAYNLKIRERIIKTLSTYQLKRLVKIVQDELESRNAYCEIKRRKL